jgi:hypothetical protein
VSHEHLLIINTKYIFCIYGIHDRVHRSQESCSEE